MGQAGVEPLNKCKYCGKYTNKGHLNGCPKTLEGDSLAEDAFNWGYVHAHQERDQKSSHTSYQLGYELGTINRLQLEKDLADA